MCLISGGVVAVVENGATAPIQPLAWKLPYTTGVLPPQKGGCNLWAHVTERGVSRPREALLGLTLPLVPPPWLAGLMNWLRRWAPLRLQGSLSSPCY